MDQAHLIMTFVKPLGIPRVEIETNEMKKYIGDLSSFKSVYCFPKNQEEWNDLSITASGFNLTWGTRFEVHVDQVIDSADTIEDVKRPS
jgi:hypothetical protein